MQFNGLTSLNNKTTVLLNRYYIVCKIGVNVSEDPASSASFMKVERAGFTKALVKLCHPIAGYHNRGSSISFYVLKYVMLLKVSYCKRDDLVSVP